MNGDDPVGETLKSNDEWAAEMMHTDSEDDYLIHAVISELAGTDAAEVLDDAVCETLETKDEWVAQPAQEAIAEDDCPAEISELGCGEWAAAVAALEATYAEDDLVGGTLETDVEWPAAADRRLAKMSELPETDADRKEWLPVVHCQSQLDGECEVMESDCADFSEIDTDSGDHSGSRSGTDDD